MASGKRASMREGPLAALFRRTDDDESPAPEAERPESDARAAAGSVTRPFHPGAAHRGRAAGAPRAAAAGGRSSPPAGARGAAAAGSARGAAAPRAAGAPA